MENTDRRFMWHGMLLFIIGMLTGIAEPQFANVRMGLSAHLEGLMNGIFLVALGAIWTNVYLSNRLKTFVFWGMLYGTYANWLTTTLAAVFGTSVFTPIAGAGHAGQPWQETIVMAGFISVAVAMLTSSAFVLWGLRLEHKGR